MLIESLFRTGYFGVFYINAARPVRINPIIEPSNLYTFRRNLTGTRNRKAG